MPTPFCGPEGWEGRWHERFAARATAVTQRYSVAERVLAPVPARPEAESETAHRQALNTAIERVLEAARSQVLDEPAETVLALYRRSLRLSEIPSESPSESPSVSWAAWKQAQNRGPKIQILPPVQDFRPTLVIPTYNRAALLKRAVASVRAQSYQDWRLIICDDGSSDDTPAYLTKLCAQDERITWVRHPQNLGHQASQDHLYRLAESELVANLSDDDLLLPGALAALVKLYRRWPWIALAGGGYYCRNERPHPFQVCRNGPYYAQDCLVSPLLELQRCGYFNPIFGGGALLRKSILTEISHWDPSLEVTENAVYSAWDWWLSMHLLGHYEVAYSVEMQAAYLFGYPVSDKGMGTLSHITDEARWGPAFLGLMQQLLKRYDALFGAGNYPARILRYFLRYNLEPRLLPQLPGERLERKSALEQDYRMLLRYLEQRRVETESEQASVWCTGLAQGDFPDWLLAERPLAEITPPELEGRF